MDDATQKLVDGLRLDAGNYGRMVRGEIEPGETFSWDQSNVRAWEAADALEAAQRPPVSPEQREALARTLFVWDTDEHPDPRPVWSGLSEAQRDVWRSGADALVARFSLPVLDVEKVARLLVEHREARFADGGCEAVCGCGAILPQTFAPPAIVFGEWWLAVHQARVLVEALPTLTADTERSTT